MRLPNGFGSVHKISGNRRRPYRARVTVGWINTENSKKRQSFKTIGYYSSKEEGLIALAVFNNNNYNFQYTDITFEKVYELWSKEHYAKINPSSKRIWIAAYKHSKPLYKMKFKNIKVADLERAISNAVVGSATKLRMKGLYNMLFKFAIKHEIVSKNYAIFLETPDVTPYIKRKPFSETEIGVLWKNLNMPYVDMILVNIYSGLRPSELISIEAKNVDLKNGIIIGGLKTKSGKNRIIPIHPKIFNLIKSRYRLKSSKLFTNENGEDFTYNSYRNRFIKVMNTLKMEHKPHDTRHTFITRAKQYKMDEYILKLIVGHKIADITENIYTHRKIEELTSEILKIKE